VCRRSAQPKMRASRAFDVISTSRFFCTNLQGGGGEAKQCQCSNDFSLRPSMLSWPQR